MDDMLLWRRRQRWSMVVFLLALPQVVFICFFVVRLIQTRNVTDPGLGFALAMVIFIFGPILLFMFVVTLVCWSVKRQYDKEWRKCGHTA
jgi:hypothetical protein